eukprot:297564-Pelagomonas_calceolata.AAC.1
MKQPFIQHASVQDFSDFLLQHNNKLYLFISELMDIVLTCENQSQADQPNTQAEGPPVIGVHGNLIERHIFLRYVWYDPAQPEE